MQRTFNKRDSGREVMFTCCKHLIFINKQIVLHVINMAAKSNARLNS